MLILKRLPQHLQNIVPELGQLVQKQNAVMRQRHLPRLGVLPTPDQSHGRGQMPPAAAISNARLANI